MKPKEIKRVDNFLEITWEDKNGKISLKKLRQSCPCAGCKDQIANQTKTSSLNIIKNTLDEQTTITNINLIGNYAIQITWQDGHSAGIYNFDYLYNLS